jgi:dCMP deaminase
MISLYMDICERIAQMSVAQRLQVGSLIVKDDNILSYGWNGTPRGWDNECEYTVPELIDVESRTITPSQLKTKPEVLHAEMNCISKVAKSTLSSEGSTMFCTHAPCIDCAKFIYQSGISSVYYKNDYRSTQGLDFLTKSGVKVNKI